MASLVVLLVFCGFCGALVAAELAATLALHIYSFFEKKVRK